MAESNAHVGGSCDWSELQPDGTDEVVTTEPIAAAPALWPTAQQAILAGQAPALVFTLSPTDEQARLERLQRVAQGLVDGGMAEDLAEALAHLQRALSEPLGSPSPFKGSS